MSGSVDGPGRPGLRLVLAASAVASALLLAPHVARVRRSWPERVAVEGPSMAPTVLPGDWLLVDPSGYLECVPRAGDLVVVPDPRMNDRLLVKRVASVTQDGRVELVGDTADRSTDSRVFGPVDPASIAGRPWFRYWPPRRAGRIR
jgi:nickel-type superoxide dismutase maturation protease